MVLVQVLIADDDPVSRRILGNMLRTWGYEVLSAADGTAAWKILQQPDPPRLAILDWMMPGRTGPELCRALREANREPYTYVLLLTARSDRNDVIEGMESGADDYITKPFDTQELKVRLRAGRRILELQAELVTAREALREQATRDPLTCLWNRYAILETLSREVVRAGRERGPLSVMMADLDHFKRINDSHGHLVGDAVLREAAHRMASSLRTYDCVGRYGGEEFLIVLPGLNSAHAMQLAERLRAAVATPPIYAGEVSVGASVSIGVTAIERGEILREQELIGLADEALYRAKALGRNRVEWSGPELEDSAGLTEPELMPAAVSAPLRNG